MRALAIVSLVSAVAIAAALIPGAHAAQPVHEATIVAKKFMFEPAEIQIVAGEPVRLVVRSAPVRTNR